MEDDAVILASLSRSLLLSLNFMDWLMFLYRQFELYLAIVIITLDIFIITLHDCSAHTLLLLYFLIMQYCWLLYDLVIYVLYDLFLMRLSG